MESPLHAKMPGANHTSISPIRIVRKHRHLEFLAQLTLSRGDYTCDCSVTSYPAMAYRATRLRNRCRAIRWQLDSCRRTDARCRQAAQLATN